MAPQGTQLRMERLRALAAQIAELKRKGREVIVVSSGAIASGMHLLGLKHRPEGLADKQALAALGQPELMKAYSDAFAEHKIQVAQILLTQEDTQIRRRYLNVRNTVRELLARGVVPIVNENDTVAADEIRMGDNDLLSALVAMLAEADALMILTDTDGLLSARPGKEKAATRIDTVEKVTPEIRKAAGGAVGGSVGSGGMATKLLAAEKMTRGGHPVLIARGTDSDVLLKAVAGESLGTIFLPGADKMPARKRWLAFGVKARGSIIVDAGARTALAEKGRSLLPKGILGTNGNFGAGDAVTIQDEAGVEFARGVVRYSSVDVAKLKGAAARDIEKLLGYSNGEEIVHRNNLVLLERGPGEKAS